MAVSTVLCTCPVTFERAVVVSILRTATCTQIERGVSGQSQLEWGQVIERDTEAAGRAISCFLPCVQSR
jgi:hypothetical protein